MIVVNSPAAAFSEIGLLINQFQIPWLSCEWCSNLREKPIDQPYVIASELRKMQKPCESCKTSEKETTGNGQQWRILDRVQHCSTGFVALQSMFYLIGALKRGKSAWDDQIASKQSPIGRTDSDVEDKIHFLLFSKHSCVGGLIDAASG